MKSIRKREDGLNSKAGLALMNMGGEDKFPVFENLDEEKEYNDWKREDIIEFQKETLNNAPLTDKYFAVIGVRRATIHDDFDYWHAAFTNLEDAKNYIEENKKSLEFPRIYNEKAEKLFELEDESEAEL